MSLEVQRGRPPTGSLSTTNHHQADQPDTAILTLAGSRMTKVELIGWVARCRDCHRRLFAFRSVTAGVGPKCAKRRRS